MASQQNLMDAINALKARVEALEKGSSAKKKAAPFADTQEIDSPAPVRVDPWHRPDRIPAGSKKDA